MTDGTTLVARVFDHHGSAIERYLRRLTGNRELARDLVQDVYVKVLRAAPSYQAQERERAWVFRIARNVFLDHYRLRREPSPVPVDEGARTVQPSQLVRVSLTQALDKLDAVDRDIVLLCEVGGLSYEDIAGLLEISVPSVRSRIYRARLALRAVLLAPAASPPDIRSKKDSDDA